MKQCFKCKTTKPLNDYYPHKEMRDGHLNKCKECCKKDSALLITKKQKNVDWVLKEQKRCREKAKKYKYSHQHNKVTKRYSISNPEKCKARRIANNAIKNKKLTRKSCEFLNCNITKTESHHSDYSKPLDVNWLCTNHHNLLHVKEREKILRRKYAGISGR